MFELLVKKPESDPVFFETLVLEVIQNIRVVETMKNHIVPTAILLYLLVVDTGRQYCYTCTF